MIFSFVSCDNPTVIKHTVAFDTDGGSEIATIEVVDGEKVAKPADPTKHGFLFAEWQLDEKTYDFASPVTKNITLKATWSVDERVWDGKAADVTWYNEESTEFTLKNASEFAGLAKLVNGGNTFANKTVKLADDIDLSSNEWTPIGLATEYVYETDENDSLKNLYSSDDSKFKIFAGTFDGQNHKISNLVAKKTRIATGLFGAVKNGSTIKNLVIENADIECAFFGGSLLGYIPNEATKTENKTTIENIVVQGDVKVLGAASYGGLIGRNETKTVMEIKKSKIVASEDSAVSMYEGGLIAGGFIGAAYGQDTLIEECSSNLSITGCVQAIGGLVGHMEDGQIINSSVSGTVKLIPDANATKTYWGYDQYGIGAFIGTVDGSAKATTDGSIPAKKTNEIVIQGCTSTAKVETKTYDGEPLFFGGLVGTIRNTLENSTYAGVNAKNIVTITE